MRSSEMRGVRFGFARCGDKVCDEPPALFCGDVVCEKCVARHQVCGLVLQGVAPRRDAIRDEGWNQATCRTGSVRPNTKIRDGTRPPVGPGPYAPTQRRRRRTHSQRQGREKGYRTARAKNAALSITSFGLQKLYVGTALKQHVPYSPVCSPIPPMVKDLNNVCCRAPGCECMHPGTAFVCLPILAVSHT
eukprot:357621-Chlamydomonas_euryale.AAC.1